MAPKSLGIQIFIQSWYQKFQSLPEKVEGAVKTGLNITHKLVKMGEKALENPEEVIKEKQVITLEFTSFIPS
jgi:hypothetical protein